MDQVLFSAYVYSIFPALLLKNPFPFCVSGHTVRTSDVNYLFLKCLLGKGIMIIMTFYFN